MIATERDDVVDQLLGIRRTSTVVQLSSMAEGIPVVRL
jgi:hypothetical protein